MSCFRENRLRALVLLLALGIGLAAQAVAATAAVMSTPMSQDMAPMVSSSMTEMGYCPACDGKDSPAAMMLGCVSAFCAASVAILEPGLSVEAAGRAAFPMVAYTKARGMTIRPALGPPRSIHQS
jgi:hypothetical protein